MKPLDASDSGGPQRVAVIRVVEAEIHRVLSGLDTLRQPPILKRHLQRRFNCRGAVV